MQTSWLSTRGCSGLLFTCWKPGTWPRPRPAPCSWYCFLPSLWICWIPGDSAGAGVCGGMGNPSCHAAWCDSMYPSPSPSPPARYGAVDFPSSGISQRPNPQLDSSLGEICQGKAAVVGLASQDWGEWGWGSPLTGHRHPPVLGSGQKSPPATRQRWSVKAGGQAQVGAQVRGCRWQRPPLLQ